MPEGSVTSVFRDCRPRGFEAVLLAAGAIVLAIQLFIPPFIGLANNGDFPHMTGKFCLGPESDTWDDNFRYFVSDYRYAPKYCWEGGLRSSEEALVWLGTRIGRVFMGAKQFDIRFMGLAHSALFLTAYSIALLSLRPLPLAARLGAGVFLLFVFTDVSYVSYFNSFYTDTAALLGLLLATGLALLMSARGASVSSLILFALAVLLVATSKPQHALLGIPPAVLLLLKGREAGGGRRKVLAFSLAAVVLFCSAGTFLGTPRRYEGRMLFNAIFHQIAAASEQPWQDLQKLGGRRDDLRYVGMHAFMPGSPIEDPGWYREFCERASFTSVMMFYLTHPSRTARILMDDLRLHARNLRQENLSNFRREDGKPPMSRTERFAAWSGLRERLFLAWPAHILVWYALFMTGSAAVIVRRASAVKVKSAWLALAVSAAGITEFAIASLADSVETDRHLFLFHAITEITFCFGLAALLTWISSAFLSRSSSGKRPARADGSGFASPACASILLILS